MEQDDLKATELDRMTSSHELQMLKAALSYFPAGPRRLLSLVIKARELKNTVELFSSPDALSICSVRSNRMITASRIARPSFARSCGRALSSRPRARF